MLAVIIHARTGGAKAASRSACDTMVARRAGRGWFGVDGASDAVSALRKTTPFAVLGDIQARQDVMGSEDPKIGGVPASVVGFQPTNRTLVHFRLWGERPEATDGERIYRVWHVSRPVSADQTI